MGKATVIPFGPQHPVLPEPIHLDLVSGRTRRSSEAIPSDRLRPPRTWKSWSRTRDYNQFIYVAERVCGICSFGHAMGLCRRPSKRLMDDRRCRARAELPAHRSGTSFPACTRHLLWLGPWRGCARLREPVHALLAASRARSSTSSKKRPAAASSSPSAKVGGVRA